jgi:hypothetical protein
MKSAIEFHDSEVVELQVTEGALHILLEPAYVHRSQGRPGIDAGSGFLQAAELVFSEAKYTEKDGPCSGPIDEGSVTIAGKRYSDMMPLPIEGKGAVTAEFTFQSGATLSITAKGINGFTKGNPQFVEEY